MNSPALKTATIRIAGGCRPLAAAAAAVFLTAGYGIGQEISVADVTDGTPGVALADGQTEVVDFGRTEPGAPLTRTFSIANTGSEDLVLDPAGLTVPAGFSLTSPWPTAVMSPTFKVVAQKSNSGVSPNAAAAFSFELSGLPEHLSVKSVEFAIPDELIFAKVRKTEGPSEKTPYIDAKKGVRIDNDPLNPLDLDPVVEPDDYGCVPDPVTGEPHNPSGDVCVEFGGTSWGVGGRKAKGGATERRWQKVTLHFRRGAFSGSSDPLAISNVAFGFGIGNIKPPALPRGVKNDGDAYGQIGMEVTVTLWDSEAMELIEVPTGVFEDDGIDNGRSEVTFGTGPGDVVGEVPVPVVIPPGQTWESVVGLPLTVQLDAEEEGVFSGDWSLENNDPDEDPFNFPIIGVVDSTPVDDTPPVIGNVPDDIEIFVSGGVCSAEVSWTEPTVSDNLDPSPTLEQTAPIDPVSGEVQLVSGATFPTGFHVIQYTATDASGNQSTAEFLVQVKDGSAPELLGCLPPRVLVFLPPGQVTGAASFPALQAFDDCDPNAQVVFSKEPDWEYPIGATEVCVYAEDASGNQSPTQCFDVIVIAGQGPATPDNPRSAELVIENLQAVPGVEDGVTISQVDHALLNESGSLVIEIVMQNAGAGNRGVLKDVGSGLGLVSRKGDPGPNGNILYYDDVTLNDLGQVGFEAYAGGFAHFNEGSGVLAPSMAVGQTAPGGGGSTFKVIQEPAFDGQGAMMSRGFLNVDEVNVTFKSDTGIWRKPAGGPLELVAREGNLIGDVIPGASYLDLGPRVVANNNGDIAFYTLVKPATGGSSSAILAGQPDDLEVVAQMRDPAPESDGALFLTFATESINDAGQVAFKAVLMAGPGGAPVDGSNNYGIYTNSNGGLERVVREGDPLPGCSNSDGAVFSTFEEIIVADKGDVFFRSYLKHGPTVSSSNDGSLWRWRAEDGALLLLAREGDRAPSTNSVFKRLIDFSVSKGGVVALTAELSHGIGDATEDNDFGVWMDRADLGVPELVMREGDVVDVGGDYPAKLFLVELDKTTSDLFGSGGHGKVVNDAGELIGRATYGFSEFTLNPDWVEGDPVDEKYTEESVGGNSGVFILGAP